MATQNIIRITADVSSEVFEIGAGPELVEEGRIGGGGTVVSVFQRIYDDGLGQYVYYTKTTIDTAPAPGDTSPNHSGSLDVTKHEVIGLEG